MGDSSLTVGGAADAQALPGGKRRPPVSQAERKRRAEFGQKYGGIMRDIKRERERSTE